MHHHGRVDPCRYVVRISFRWIDFKVPVERRPNVLALPCFETWAARCGWRTAPVDMIAYGRFSIDLLNPYAATMRRNYN
ncbi:hypothetical protein OHA25_52675 [Nonomuraea sp. NBC_00507]|uniref:hypothetical protein n=1 Tax=Nonomuraea sp. NBC_00507 TaxID=2976002 RepID=UPI002E173D41